MTRPTGGTGSRRLDTMNRRDHERRRVRTTNGRPRRRRAKLGIRIGGPMTMLWGVVSLAVGIIALLAQSVLFLVFTGLSLGLTALAAWIESKGSGAAVPPPPRKVPPKPRPRGNGSPRPRKRPTGTGGGGRPCSDACKRSGKPKSTCRCTAPDCAHGSMAGVGGKP